MKQPCKLNLLKSTNCKKLLLLFAKLFRSGCFKNVRYLFEAENEPEIWFRIQPTPIRWSARVLKYAQMTRFGKKYVSSVRVDEERVGESVWVCVCVGVRSWGCVTKRERERESECDYLQFSFICLKGIKTRSTHKMTWRHPVCCGCVWVRVGACVSVSVNS